MRKTKQPTPRLYPETTRLSLTLKYQTHIGNTLCCQACGTVSTVAGVHYWQEHDHNDQPEQIFVPLCSSCSTTLIEPHPRLYRQLHPHEPAAGAMPICQQCPRRVSTKCMHPHARGCGGTGLLMLYPTPSRAFVDGSNFSGVKTLWRGQVEDCEGRDETTAPALRMKILKQIIESGREVPIHLDTMKRFFPADTEQELTDAVAGFMKENHYYLAMRGHSYIFTPVQKPA